MKIKIKNVFLIAALTMSVLGCYRGVEDAIKSATSSGVNTGIVKSPSIQISVSSGGAVVFDSTKASVNGFKLKQGVSARISGQITNFKPGDTAVVKVTDTTVPSMPVVASGNSNLNGSFEMAFTAPKSGDFAIRADIAREGKTFASSQYVASVECGNPTFKAESLNGSAISVTGSNSVYTYSAAGVITGANGQAPYRCAFDFNGDGAMDSPLTDCAQSQTNILSTYVRDRKISVVVADSCNTSHAVSKTIMLNASEPSMPGNIFIHSLNSAMTGCATSQRVANVQYRAENSGGKKPCNPFPNNGGFTIECLQNYGLPHSKSFGMKVDVTGLGTYDVRANPGTISAANAKVSKVTYSTDELSDESPALAFEGGTCTSSVQARVIESNNAPCEHNPSMTRNSAVIEVYGSYTCTNVANGCGSMTVSGKFDGFYNVNDNCVGGGGQGGGGDPPPSF